MTIDTQADGGREESRALATFRAEVRQWCSTHVPPDWQSAQAKADEAEYLAFQRWWYQELRAAGYAVPHWPEEWGGGYSVAEQVVLFEELAAAGAPRLALFFVSLYHTPATLLAAGTGAQKKRHLPAILDGEIWCQGFSEPNAGSDLAALSTRAVRDGDHYIVNGQKVWSSMAHHADWCLLLARTDPTVRKHKGISYFLLDMHSEGVEARPIRQASGAAEFCELFLTDVIVPVENLVGAENDGWRVAQSTLTSERGTTMLELSERLARAFGWLTVLAREKGFTDSATRERLADFHTRLRILRLLCDRMIQGHLSGGGARPEASILKLYYSELLQSLMEYGVELDGLTGHLAAAKPLSAGWESGLWLLDFIGSWEWTIAGGTNEIQRTVIAERVLGLPRESSAP